ncbi:site-2 protease family protein [Paraburkholderia sp. BR14374]|uniref:site-2 protease family protein n=1 Tax=Paraburkholderia sp. BR14374 TaxID=3237007 RepID=UPI0034CEB124
MCVGAHVQILIHELGHLVPSLAFGKRANGLRIGVGPSIHIFRGSRFPISVGLYAYSGRLEVEPPNKPWQAAIAYAAGPAATIGVAVASFNYHPHTWASWVLDVGAILNERAQPGSIIV